MDRQAFDSVVASGDLFDVRRNEWVLNGKRSRPCVDRSIFKYCLYFVFCKRIERDRSDISIALRFFRIGSDYSEACGNENGSYILPAQ